MAKQVVVCTGAPELWDGHRVAIGEVIEVDAADAALLEARDADAWSVSVEQAVWVAIKG